MANQLWQLIKGSPKIPVGAPQLTPKETARQAPAAAIPFREYSPSMTVVWEELIRKERSRHGKAHGFKELLTKKEQDRIRTQREGIGRFVLAWCKQSMQLTKHGRINTEGFLQAVDRCQEAEVRHVSSCFHETPRCAQVALAEHLALAMQVQQALQYLENIRAEYADSGYVRPCVKGFTCPDEYELQCNAKGCRWTAETRTNVWAKTHAAHFQAQQIRCPTT